ncbi:MAG: septal ring lytic transglycosylase RlpA family protein [Bryobacteraceae bacterium]
MKQRILPLIASLAFVSSVLVLPACRKHHGIAKAALPPQPSHTTSPPRSRDSSEPAGKRTAVPVGYTEEGIASWYGIPYHGRKAANGETYDMETLVAAHRVMPFNTWLKVTNLANNESVNVRIIDRGPFVEGRIIDLSKAAARQIGLLGPGLGRVRLEVTGAPADIPSNDFYAVQVGAFSVAANAERVRMQYAQRFGTAQLAMKQGAIPLWRVLIGKEPSITAAQELADVLSAENRTVFVVRLDATVIKPGTSIVPGLMPETW